MSLDFYLFQKINQFAGQVVCLDSLAIFFAEYLGYFLIAILFLFLFKNYKKYWQFAVEILAAVILSRLVITEIVRFFWERPRPFLENHVNLILSHEATGSFPSGHAAFYFAISTVIYSYNKKAGLLFFLASSLIAISRVFVGIHWPTDILAGVIVGIFSGRLVLKLSKRFLK